MEFDKLVKEQVINLRDRHLQDEDLVVLAKVLQEINNLEELCLYDNPTTLADGKFTDALVNNRTLRNLDLCAAMILVLKLRGLKDWHLFSESTEP